MNYRGKFITAKQFNGTTRSGLCIADDETASLRIVDGEGITFTCSRREIKTITNPFLNPAQRVMFAEYRKKLKLDAI